MIGGKGESKSVGRVGIFMIGDRSGGRPGDLQRRYRSGGLREEVFV